MKLAIASGKGGTGKTTLSCAIALAQTEPVCLLDCDVEEPNSHFFIQPEIERTEAVFSLVPKVDETKCTGCGECGRVCQFSAIISLGKKTMVFNELCHSCGACARICPTHAIEEVRKPIGSLEIGRKAGVRFVSGRMDVGVAMSPPVIRATLKHAVETELTLVDCPPGTSCPFVTAVKGCDAVLLVTEPTPFGLHDLVLAIETIRELGLPFTVVVNRANGEQNRISDYCAAENIPLLLQIPEDRRVAEAYSRGQALTTAMPELKTALASIPQQMKDLTEGRKEREAAACL
ncbi:ATP-binding protein [Pontiella sp.]|uniref:ATP-binding protein n=1 Tax=Pontiella sp. TaxID=2837462 RepID=UPI0035656D7E